MKTVGLNEIGNGVIFGNGVCVVNTTPHPVTIQDINGDVVSVPTTVLINAKVEETQVSSLFVKSTFVGNNEGLSTIANIKKAYAETGETATLIIVGSIIAAQAYPGKVVGLTPVPGFERVAPSEKRMRCDKFTIFE